MDYLVNESLKELNMTNNTMQQSVLSSAMPWIIGAIVLIILPFIFTGGGSITIMNQIGITIVLAMSYNMLLGQGGMLSFSNCIVIECSCVFNCLFPKINHVISRFLRVSYNSICSPSFLEILSKFFRCRSIN